MDDLLIFGDEFFMSEEKKPNKEQCFKPSFQNPGWFLSKSQEQVSSFTTEAKECNPKLCESYSPDLSLLKYQGDYFYLKRDFLKAISCYEQVLILLPSNNLVTRRELYENTARCSAKIERFCNALNYCNELHGTSKTVENLTVSLSCLVDVNLQCGRFQDASISCMKLITIHRLNSHLWLRLSLTLACLSGIHLPNIATMQNIHGIPKHHECDCARVNCNEKYTCLISVSASESQRRLLILFCIMMSRYILVGVQTTSVGFCAEQISSQLVKIDDDLVLFRDVTEQHGRELDRIVTKFVFGYLKETGAEAEASGDFVDRGSSKFKSESSEVNFSSLSDVNFKSFSKVWFLDVLKLN